MPAPPVIIELNNDPEGGRRTLVEEFRIVFDACHLKDFESFLFEGHLVVVDFLVLNVLSYFGDFAVTNGKGSVSALPAKVSNLFLKPMSRSLFDFLHEVGNRMHGFHSDEKMNMIGDASDFKRDRT